MNQNIDLSLLLSHLSDSWKNKVSKDCKNGFMWNGENCVTMSLSYHLRNAIPESWDTIRFWFECSFPRLNGWRKGRVDMLVVDASKSISNLHPDYWDDILNGTDQLEGLSKQGILLAIEVKYASTNWEADFNKLVRLQERTSYPIIPVFAFVDFTRSRKENPSQYQVMLRKAKKNGIMLLFGDPHTPEDWKVDNTPTI